MNFKIFLDSEKKIEKVNKNLFNQNIIDLVNKDLLTIIPLPGKLNELVNLSKEIKIDLKILI